MMSNKLHDLFMKDFAAPFLEITGRYSNK